MSLREDLLRALDYGKAPYYSALQNTNVYQKELNKIYTDHQAGMWTALEKFIPQFTTQEFQKRRQAYQARYGTSINVPGFEDIIHIGTMAKISDAEMAAHRAAQRYKLPSPLSADQLRTLATKRARFLRALASPTPSWVNNVGAVAMALDNVEDGLVTAAVFARLGSYATKKLWQKSIPGQGWLLLGSDILNLMNIFGWATFAASGGKRKWEEFCERNPFHKKARATRAMKLKRTWPTFGEAIEVAQTCDQLFGYGLCLGGLVGMLTDVFTRATEYTTFRWRPEVYNFNIWEGDTPKNREAMNKIADDLFRKLATDWETLKFRMKDIAYGAKSQDEYIRRLLEAEINKAGDWIRDSAVFAWQHFTQYAAPTYERFTSALMGSMIASTGASNLSQQDQLETYLTAAASMGVLGPIWRDADPLPKFKDVRNYKFTPPAPKDAGTIGTLEELTENWKQKLNWPYLDVKEATAEQIYFEYAHRIKDHFLAFSSAHKNDYAAAIAAGEVTDYVENVLRTFSDDGTIQSGRDEWVNTAINMLREHISIPPDADSTALAAFNQWVESYARSHASAPSANDIRRKAKELNIKLIDAFPRRAFQQAYKLFPQWQALQDQLGDFFVPD